jgi:hypothetical protein
MPMDHKKVEAIRHLVWHCLSPHTAEAAGLSLAQLQQFAAFGLMLSEAQLNALARYLNVEHGVSR